MTTHRAARPEIRTGLSHRRVPSLPAVVGDQFDLETFAVLQERGEMVRTARERMSITEQQLPTVRGRLVRQTFDIRTASRPERHVIHPGTQTVVTAGLAIRTRFQHHVTG